MMKKYIFAIDTSKVNNGSCLSAFKEKPLYADRCNMLVTSKGTIYKEYTEQISTELASHFIFDRFQFMQKSSLIMIEKAMIVDEDENGNKKFVKDPTELMRGNVVLERTLYAMIYTYHLMGLLPPVIVVAPREWQTAVGIPKMSYKAHKITSCAKFADMVGSDTVEFLKSEYYDRKYDDIAEAYLMTQAGHILFDDLYERATTYHNHTTSIGNFGKNVNKETRMQPPRLHTDDIKFVDGKTRFLWNLDYIRYVQTKKHDKQFPTILTEPKKKYKIVPIKCKRTKRRRKRRS